MNPSYLRIRLPKAKAMARFAAWKNSPELEPPKEVALSDASGLACDKSRSWRGSAVYVYENGGWTIFEDLSGHCGGISADTWLRFAGSDDFVFAGYNDAIGYGELIVIQNGTILREFLHDEQHPEANSNCGRLVGSNIEPIESWIQAARFVDQDDLVFSERGLLWLHGKSA
jgi:hypothetical protein